MEVFVWLFFRQADGEEIPKSSGDESEPSKIDPSRLGSEWVNRMVEFQTEFFCKRSNKKLKDILIKEQQDLKRDGKTESEAINLSEL